MSLRSLCLAVRYKRSLPCNISNRTFTPLLNLSSSFSSTTEGAKTSEEQQQERDDKWKVRRAYALGGCLMVMWFSTHGLLLYRRRSEFRLLNAKLPPISWEQFRDEYLQKDLVKTIVLQPQFEVANVYLHSPQEELVTKKLSDILRAGPDKFTRPPDVRVVMEGNEKEVKGLIREAQIAAKIQHRVEVDIDQFPSYRELSFILASSIFAVAVIAAVK